MRSVLLRALQWLMALAVVGFAGWQVASNWNSVRAAQIALTFRPLPLLAALALVWAGFVALILAWRITVTAAGRPLAPRDAAHIWIVSSLGKYLPGKVWALAGMMVLARDRGISGRAAAAAAVFQQIVSLGVGAILVFLSGRSQLIDRLPGGPLAFWLLLTVAVIALCLPLSSRVMALAALAVQTVGKGRLAPGETDGEAFGMALPWPVLVRSALANAVAWFAYGGALLLLAHGLLPDLAHELSFERALGGFTAAYIAGVLAFLAPGGIGVREGLIVLLLAPAVGEGGAAVLALATRVLFTLAEFGAAAPFVFAAKEKSRVR